MSDFPAPPPGGPSTPSDGSFAPEINTDLFGQANYQAVNLWLEDEIVRLTVRETARRATHPSPIQVVYTQLPLPLGDD